MELKNYEIDTMLTQLEPLLDKCGEVGYIAAINTNRLQDAVKEYHSIRDAAVRRYGEEDGDSYRIDRGTEGWDAFLKEMEPVMEHSHDVAIEKLAPSKVIEELTGRQMLELRWMIDFKEA